MSETNAAEGHGRPAEPKPASVFLVERLLDRPIIGAELPGLEGERGANINGPSLIRVPDWVEQPLGRYYLYFAHHGGHYIRMAYADALTGPWTVYEPGVLHRDDGPGVKHIASPDVLPDADQRCLRMYFHQPVKAGGQMTFVALSQDGLCWDVREPILGPSYFRVFRHGGFYYAYAKNANVDGSLFRSRDGLGEFEPGPSFLPGIRHAAALLRDDTLYLLYSAAGDRPERILLTTFDLRRPWPDWTPTVPEIVLEPELAWEGADLPLEPSRYGASWTPVRQLRDPAVYEEDGRLYLLYSGAGEKGIGLARLHWS